MPDNNRPPWRKDFKRCVYCGAYITPDERGVMDGNYLPQDIAWAIHMPWGPYCSLMNEHVHDETHRIDAKEAEEVIPPLREYMMTLVRHLRKIEDKIEDLNTMIDDSTERMVAAQRAGLSDAAYHANNVRILQEEVLELIQVRNDTTTRLDYFDQIMEQLTRAVFINNN